LDRTYLFVPPEEKADVQALGAQWDADSKRWYIGSDEARARFSRWLPGAETEEDEEFTIVSSEAFVASATVRCRQCGTSIEVICLHCESGSVSGEPLDRFTVSGIRAMDEALAHQLRRWPMYRRIDDPETDAGDFANHCSHCGAPQCEFDLHAEPDAPFFNIPAAESGSITLTPLSGAVRMSGDEHFEVE
jgi:uncharacterized protein DUF5710